MPSSVVCTPILAHRLADLSAGVERSAPDADLLELRLDYLDDFNATDSLGFLTEVLERRPRPTILTYRPQEQGGARDLSIEQRWAFWERGLALPADYFDLEADLVRAKLAGQAADWERIIVSLHDFSATPENLPGFVDRNFPPAARTIKLAVTARSVPETAAVFHLLRDFSASHPHKRIIAIGMGTPGAPTRILGPAFGGRLTYSIAADGTPSAPGQFSARSLRETFRIADLTRETAIAGVIGKPVMHSLSPHMHNAAYRELGLDWVYVPIEVQDDGRDLAEFIRRVVHPATREIGWDARGFSVTLPHKVAVAALVDSLTPTASGVGAVNTLIVHDGKIIGDNTDAAGFMRPLERAMDLKNQRVAVLGAGGSANAVIFGLLASGATPTVFARNPEKARALEDCFGIQIRNSAEFSARDFDGIVNTTPVGMTGKDSDASPVPADRLVGATWAYDLVYTPRETRFLREARERGLTPFGGLAMLVEQAALQFELWTGRPAPLEVMRHAAECALG